MKKILLSVLLFSQITSPAYASEVIDVFEEYAPINDFVCKSYPVLINIKKNQTTEGDFFTECSAPYSVHLTSHPVNGSIELTPEKNFVYIPNENFTGTDSFQYRISSYGVFSNISNCSINVFSETSKNIPQTDFYYEDMKNHPAKTVCEKLAEKNIIKGERVGKKYYFYPNKKMDRATAISYLCSTLKVPDKQETAIIFKDHDLLCEQLQKDAYICYLSGIITGKPIDEDVYLCPDEPLTRAEMFTMIDRACAGKTNSNISLDFPDLKSVPDYAKQSVKNLVSNGFLENSDSQLLRPCDIATKAEFSMLLYKLVSLNEESTTKTLSQRIKEGFYANVIT